MPFFNFALFMALPLWMGLPGDPGASAQEEPVLVFAAASTRDAMQAMAAAWRSGGGAEVVFNFDATSRLATQIAGGAPADAFISADPAWMAWLEERITLYAPPTPLAGNGLVVLVAPDGPDLDDLGQLPTLGGLLALAGENVPAGRYARAAMERAGVWEAVEGRVVRGGNVRSVLEWVHRGEVGAAIVYATDARAVPGLKVALDVPELLTPAITYWAAPISPDPRAADFVDFATGRGGQAILRDFGFRQGDVVEEDVEGQFQASAPSVGRAIYLSLVVAFLATLLATAPAVGSGWLLARFDFPGKSVISTILLTPLVLPPVVTGFLLLSLMGRNGWLGGALSTFGITVPFTLLGATVAALVVGFPLYMMAARGAFEAVDRRYAEVAWTLGDRPTRSFWRVSLPMALPGVLAGAVLAFARALGEFGATIVLAGNIEGRTRTIPLAVYTALESPGGARIAWALVIASVAIAAFGLLGFESLSRAQKRRMGGGGPG